jgi:hypothetical protein
MKDFRDLKVLGEGTSLDPGCIQGNNPSSSRRALWLDRSDAPFQRLDRCQSCGGLRQAWQQRVQRYLQIASGSASELDYHLLLSRDLQFLDPAQHDTLARELGELRRMLTVPDRESRSGTTDGLIGAIAN